MKVYEFRQFGMENLVAAEREDAPRGWGRWWCGFGRRR